MGVWDRRIHARIVLPDMARIRRMACIENPCYTVSCSDCSVDSEAQLPAPHLRAVVMGYTTTHTLTEAVTNVEKGRKLRA